MKGWLKIFRLIIRVHCFSCEYEGWRDTSNWEQLIGVWKHVSHDKDISEN
jgi:hypothetical protein